MRQTIERKIAKLTITFTLSADSPLQEFFEFNEFSLDPSLLKSSPSSLTHLTVKGYVDFTGKDEGDYIALKEGAYSYLVLKAVYEIEITLSKNAVERMASTKQDYPPPPIPTQDFTKLKEYNLQLCDGIIKYLSWRKGYKLDSDYKSRIVKQWEWKVNEFYGDNHIEPHWMMGDLLRVKPEEFSLITVDDFNDFYRIQNTGRAIPLHHELLAEAHSLLYTDKARSSYIMMYSSIEVATKSLITHKKPETVYLIDNIQSPELKKLYDQYINKEIILDMVSKEELVTIHDMTTTRNKIAHTGLELNPDVLRRHYDFAKILIDRIDSAMGYTWALKIPSKSV
ncbi:hypothetical protein [Fibrella forsythiae]|uniref:Apea-like HEPN domain-containing protein n=1 Tax=Fibrella forsythiae TaxID=2817061 RepID=A0ABS3JCS2_9BACT|nr:hypothetical protein [Fibrella forsythiae]MBO0947236.1 hypothetical protein [Fibrella forsythiae]